MKFLVDAQLPYLLAEVLCKLGYDAIHTLDLPQQNASSDTEIIEFALVNKRVVISKDADFLQRYLVKKQPEKLLLVTTGNIKNKELLSLFRQNIDALVPLLEKYAVVELTKEAVVVHY